MFMLLWSY